MATRWRLLASNGTDTGLSRRLARVERELRRLEEAHRLLLAYVRGIDADLAELEDRLPLGDADERDGSVRSGGGPERAGRQAMVFVECGECRRTVALAEEELGDFTDPIRCPYCGAELLKAWKPASTR